MLLLDLHTGFSGGRSGALVFPFLEEFSGVKGFSVINKAVDVFLREGSDTLLQYSCLENPMDGEAWWATVHGVTKSRT